MNTHKRLTDLLKILEKRDPKTPGLADRILSVKKRIAEVAQPIDEVKKKKKILQEVEVDE